jgi:hypothetical protein
MISGKDYLNENAYPKEEDNCPMFWRKFKLWLNARFKAEEDVVPAATAYCRATYGANTSVSDIIKLHQHKINRLITEKTAMRSNGDTFTDYRCVYSFPKDVEPYINTILKVFVDKGYKVINLSEKIDEIQDEHVYLISWYQDHL